MMTGGKELVPVLHTLPATETFSMPLKQHQEIRESFKNAVGWSYDFDKKQVNLMRGLGGGAALLFGAVALAAPPALVIAAPTLALFFFGGGAMQKSLEANGHDGFRRAMEETQVKFKQAQIEFYAAQKKRIVELADTHLGNGGLISAQDAAWLGNIDPDHLSEATDQLAITVLQIRQMLAYQRCNDFNSDGSRAVQAPLTFRGVGFDAGRPLHRSWLREKMAQADHGIEEDANPVIQVAEFENVNVKKPGYIAALFNFLNPVSNWSRKEKLLEMQLPKVKEIEVQCVQPLADFAEALKDYESRNAPLDLPAMRGWKGPQRRALAAPKAL
jgi:hypothetical protein